ncbi:hypothetical protein B0H21DRAFT_743852 [Amylocystis lapponica]|nr:hypothetical protein B0H21DRAFT_743852 [Amylocystis lapponica]
MSYKEKFQTLREKYEQVTADHSKFERELAIADEKVKKLQEECNLLLDAVDIAVPAQPTLLYYLSRDPIPPQYHSYTVPPQPAPGAPPPAPPQPSQPARPRHRKTPSQTNGNSNGVKRRQ